MEIGLAADTVKSVLGRAMSSLLKPPRAEGCTRETRRCDFWNWGPGYVRPDCCTAHMTEVIFFADDLLTRHGVVHWLEFGTLLGAVRDEALIPWDSDADLGFFARDAERIRGLADEIAAAGHLLDLSDPSGVIRIKYSPTNLQYVDLWPFHEQDGFLSTCLPADREWPGVHNSTSFPKRYVEELGEARLYGRTLSVPAPVHEFLSEHRYGPDYMTPQREMLMLGRFALRITPQEKTPLVEELLERLSERDRRLAEVKAQAALSRFYAWRNWADPGLPEPPADRYLRAAGAGIPPAERTPTVARVIEAVAALDQAIDEFESPSLRVRMGRARRRVSNAREILADRLGSARNGNARDPQTNHS